MQVVIKHYKELTTDELFDIYKLRSAVFVVEQNCVYQDIDEADKAAYHLYLKDADGIQAYLRVLPKGVRYDEASIGRVISVKRRCGLATWLLKEAILVAKEKFGAKAANTISRSIGARYNLKIEIKRIPVAEGERFLLCSDGFWELIDEKEMCAQLKKGINKV